MKQVVVVGGGIAGLAAAATLRRLQIPTTILERGDTGGVVRGLHLQFPDDSCGACRLVTSLSTSCLRLAPQIAGVDIIQPADVVELKGAAPNIQIRFSTPSGEGSISAGAVIVATGADVADAPPHLKNASPQRVMTLQEAENRYWSGWRPKGRVAIALCVGSRTAEYPVCGAFCCLAALRLGSWLSASGAEVTVFAMDIRAATQTEWQYAENCLKRVHLVRCRINRAEAAKGGVRLGWQEENRIRERTFNRLICATPQRPDKSALTRLGVKTDQFGFGISDEERGVFVCGYAASPCTVEEAVQDAEGAAMRAAAVLQVHPKTARPPRVAICGLGRNRANPYPPQKLAAVLQRFGIETDVLQNAKFERTKGALLINGKAYGAVVVGYKAKRKRPPSPEGVVPLSQATKDMRGDVVFVLCQNGFTEGRGCVGDCCERALQLALALMRNNPKRRVVVLTKEVMMRGLKEHLFLEARKAGVLVVRYPHNCPPEIERRKRGWRVRFYDTAVGRKLVLSADFVVVGDWWEFEALKEEAERGKFCRRDAGGGVVRFEGDEWSVAAAVMRVLCGGGGRITVSRRRCINCGLCADVCPQKARWLTSGKLIYDETLCIGCGLCVAACQSGATTVEEKTLCV